MRAKARGDGYRKRELELGALLRGGVAHQVDPYPALPKSPKAPRNAEDKIK